MDQDRQRQIESALNATFGFGEFRPGQEQVISALLEGRSALAVFPTGGGKSLCYQLPALLLEGVTLVVSPLIALMKDQIDFLTARGVAAARLDSSLSPEELRAVTHRLSSGELKLLYAAPERFNNERFLQTLKRTRISLLAIDEAHCISEWGHNFRPDYLKLADAARELKVERVLALTATATPEVAEDIGSSFDIAPGDRVVTGFYRPNLTALLTPVRPEERDSMLLDRLTARPPGSAIVYVTLQKTAQRVADALTDAGLPARAYHAGLSSELRAEVQEWWMARDDGIAVATIAFGMGIDKAAVRYVYHYNLPRSLESYTQEIGRAGRDGAPSTVEMLACTDDIPVIENFVYGDTPAPGALSALVDEMISGPAQFSVGLAELSDRLDLRPLVLRTALTYLELAGLLRQGTPFYARYEARLLKDMGAVTAEFAGEPGLFAQTIFERAKRGRIWYQIDPDETARQLDAPRSRVVRALEVMQARGLAEVRASDLRHSYTRIDTSPDAHALTAALHARFDRREALEMERMRRVTSLVEKNGCQVAALCAYFGEVRPEPCGHCTWCLSGRAAKLFAPAAEVRPPGGIDERELEALRLAHPAALGDPRQTARFLCGLSSPALTRAKISRHRLFGALENARFPAVLEWCEGLDAPGRKK